MDACDPSFPPEHETEHHAPFADDYGPARVLDPEAFEYLMRTL